MAAGEQKKRRVEVRPCADEDATFLTGAADSDRHLMWNVLEPGDLVLLTGVSRFHYHTVRNGRPAFKTEHPAWWKWTHGHGDRAPVEGVADVKPGGSCSYTVSYSIPLDVLLSFHPPFILSSGVQTEDPVSFLIDCLASPAPAKDGIGVDGRG